MFAGLFRRNPSSAESAIHRAEILTETFTQLLSNQLNEQELLQNVVNAVVDKLGYKACLMALVVNHQGKSILPIVAFQFTTGLSRVVGKALGQQIEGHILEVGQKIAGMQLLGAWVTVDAETAKENLGVRTILEKRLSSKTNDLGDLFVPAVSRGTASALQTLAGIQMMATVPLVNKQGELVGNIYAGTNNADISDEQIMDLQTFALAASVAINNAQQVRETMRMGLLATGFGDVVHRVKNLLGGVGFDLGEVLESSATDKYSMDIIKSALHKIDSAVELIDTLNKTAREKDFGYADINVELQNACKTLGDGAKYGYVKPDGIKIYQDLTKERVYVNASTSLLREAFRIIMKNACEAMGDEGELHITSTVVASDKHVNKYCLIAIRDTGVGIPENKIADLFKLKPGSDNKDGSLGYGLWSAMLRIKWFGGELTCESKMGDRETRGTTFNIKLPMLEINDLNGQSKQ